MRLLHRPGARLRRAAAGLPVSVFAASPPALPPSIIAFPAFQRQFMRGLTSGAAKG
ncbi:hypothetical protein [Microbispora hainanensis]|uniref:hypothetical protein n=1 Tax=Microbispora hainanensis TaxID=568844 RepID=UPI00142F0DA4|nr:hypothetical protein [Microbispora hainanensis]